MPAGLPGQRLLFGLAGELPIHMELVGPLERTYLGIQAAAKEHPGQDQYDQQARDADAAAAVVSAPVVVVSAAGDCVLFVAPL